MKAVRSSDGIIPSAFTPVAGIGSVDAPAEAGPHPDNASATLRQAILPGIIHPSQVADLTVPQLEQLAAEIRTTLVQTVSRTGGHLAPSLGVVELTLALLSVFNPARDKLIWDVGHQAYAYKLLTGRRDRFHTLRQFGGISGFPSRDESPFDHFGVGHSSTSVSAALGMAVARDMAGGNHHVVSIIGDGSLTAGLAYEGMNQAGAVGGKFIVILNDNEMSISKNVGALSLFMSRNLSARWVRKVKREVEAFLAGIPTIGDDLVEIARRSKHSFKNFFTPGILFEALRFNYIGAVDGHNIEALQKVLHLASGLDRPVLIHVLTRKGKGYAPAEANPVRFHGVGCFEPDTGRQSPNPPATEERATAPLAGVVPGAEAAAPPAGSATASAVDVVEAGAVDVVEAEAGSSLTYTRVFGDTLLTLAEEDDRIVAVTAAMPEGTGLAGFAERFPARFFDVGICEPHAVTFAAGLASQGLRPVVCIYSTFMQRAYDQIVHDVCLQRLPVTLCLDRAGLVGEDGATHQGAFDLTFLRHIPGLTLFAPRDGAELQRGLITALASGKPFALRYPRGAVPEAPLLADPAREKPLPVGSGVFLRRGTGDIAVIAVGSAVLPAVEAADMLEAEGTASVTVFDARWVKPLPENTLKEIVETYDKFLLVEENTLSGGFSSAVLEWLGDASLLGNGKRIVRAGLPDAFVPHGSACVLRKQLGLNAFGLAERIRTL